MKKTKLYLFYYYYLYIYNRGMRIHSVPSFLVLMEYIYDQMQKSVQPWHTAAELHTFIYIVLFISVRKSA